MNSRDTQENSAWVQRRCRGFPARRLRQWHHIFSTLLAVALFASASFADTLVLRNGQRIEGTLSNRALVQSDPSQFHEITFLIDTPNGPTLQIYNVDEIEYIQLQTGSEITVIDFRLAAASPPAIDAPKDSSDTQWSFGMKAGLNLAHLRGKDSEGLDDFQRGAVAGVFFSGQKSPSFAIRVEALYTQKGGKGSATSLDGPVEITFKLNYLEVPVLFIGSLPSQGSTRLSAFVGPSLAVLTSSIVDTKGFESLGIPNGEVDLKDDTKPVDLSLVLGVEVGFKIGEGRRLLIGANYTLGILDWSETAGVELRNGALGLTVGLSSPLGSSP